MSKIALQGNPSGTGTFQIAAPNSNSDRVLTLPDAAGTVATDAKALADAVAQFTGTNTQLTANGYQRLPSGLIIQWGIRTTTGATVVNFPIAFPTACLSVNATSGSNGGFPVVVSVTTSTFNLDSAATNNRWIAVGY